MNWVKGLSIAQRAAAAYAVLIVVAGAAALIAMLSGKDSVAMWPLMLLSFPTSIIPILVFSSDAISFQALPDSLNGLIPVLVWAPLQIAGIVQAVIVWWFVSRRSRGERKGRTRQ
ncbi:hypothetical protein AB0K48_01795 [Nonomuraea sp. NPDC055795]